MGGEEGREGREEGETLIYGLGDLLYVYTTGVAHDLRPILAVRIGSYTHFSFTYLIDKDKL